MHLWGAVLVILGGLLLRDGILAERREKKRILQEILSSLRMLRDAIHTTLLPIPMLLRRRKEKETQGFFATVLKRYNGQTEQNLGEAWESAARELPLQEWDREILAEIASSFSGTEEEILRAVSAAAEQLELSLSRQEDRLRQEQPLITVLCLSVSLIASILLA